MTQEMLIKKEDLPSPLAPSKAEKRAKRAVILLSGGLDSLTCLGMALDSKYICYPMSFNYGQRHTIENDKAQEIVEHYQKMMKPVQNLSWINIPDFFHGSALTDDIDVPLDRTEQDMKEIPITYVPGRNLIMLSFALSYAEMIDAEVVYIGVNAIDYSGYVDCRPEFIKAMRKVARLSSKKAVEGGCIEIMTPLQNISKAQIIKKGLELNVPYHLSWSCYTGGEKACGRCDSCKLRLTGFAENDKNDPVPYM